MPQPAHLFFYGILRPDVADWPFLEGLGPGEPATTRGTLHAIPDPNGWYPALTPGKGVVHGMLHEAAKVDLAAIDAFEGADYERGEVVVALDAAPPSPVHAYLWVAPLPSGAEPIPHGDFARWLAETGSKVYAQP